MLQFGNPPLVGLYFDANREGEEDLTSIGLQLRTDCMRARKYPSGEPLPPRHTCYLRGRSILNGYHLWSVVQPAELPIFFLKEKEYVVNVAFIHSQLRTRIYRAEKSAIDAYRMRSEDERNRQDQLSEQIRDSREELFGSAD